MVKQSPLQTAALFLSPLKRDVFRVCYSSMRMIDDVVDEGFLLSLPQDRLRKKQEVLQEIDSWWQSVQNSFMPSFTATGYYDEFFYSFHDLLQKQKIFDPSLWYCLAVSMKQDVEEKKIITQKDFDTYCEGACVSSAVIFLLLLLSEEKEGALVLERDIDLSFIKDSAYFLSVFCYLVHMLRDLDKDVTRGRAYFKIPEYVWRGHVSWDDLYQAVLEGDTKVISSFFDIILHYMSWYAKQSEEACDRIISFFDKREKEAFSALISPYQELYERWAFSGMMTKETHK